MVVSAPRLHLIRQAAWKSSTGQTVTAFDFNGWMLMPRPDSGGRGGRFKRYRVYVNKESREMFLCFPKILYHLFRF